MYFSDSCYPMGQMSQMGQMPMMTQQELVIPHSDLIKMVQNCATTCYYTMVHCVKQPDVASRQNQINMLHLCARMCDSQATYIPLNVAFAKQHAIMCAAVCEECARECAKFSDPVSQYCAQVCLQCAAHCRRFAEMM